MNKCFFMGRIITDVDFKFMLDNKNDSISTFNIELSNTSIIKAITFNERADYSYRKLEKEDIVLIEGRLDSMLNVIVQEVEKLDVIKNK